MTDRLAIAAVLREISALLALQGGKAWQARAYERGARALEALQMDVGTLLAQERLTDVPGIGAGLAATIAEVHRTGRSAQLERLRAALPRGAAELSRVPGLTLRRIGALQEALGVTTVAELAAACAEGRVRTVKGFGEKLERQLAASIEALLATGAGGGAPTELLLHEAERDSDALLGFVRSLPGVRAAEAAGPVRRRRELVDHVAIAALADAGEEVLDALARWPAGAGVAERTAGACTLQLPSGVPAVVAVARDEVAYAASLLHRTGAPAHVALLHERARARGLVLAPDGLHDAASGDRRSAASEAEIYEALGLPFLPPETREGTGEIEAAQSGELPAAADLLQEQDVAGMVHCHTTWSDGKHTIAEMARAADALGMQYLTITDHSATAHYAGGLDEDRLQRQWDEIARVQATVRVKLLRGTECDILADGSLDWPDRVLERLDVVIASVHNRYRMDREQMTQRLVRAMRHPCFKIWGHALGRYVARRPPIDCRVEAVLDAAAESRAAIEINGDPHRLDMEPRWQREARRRGLAFVVSTDAHSTAQMRNLRFAVAMARRGWVARREVLNTLPVGAFAAAVRPA